MDLNDQTSPSKLTSYFIRSGLFIFILENLVRPGHILCISDGRASFSYSFFRIQERSFLRRCQHCPPLKLIDRFDPPFALVWYQGNHKSRRAVARLWGRENLYANRQSRRLRQMA